MRIALFSARSYERALLDELNVGYGHELAYFETPLGPETASLASGFPAVCVFVNDIVDANVLGRLGKEALGSSRPGPPGTTTSTRRRR